MLTDNVIEFMNYKNALKGNYRKGVHTMRCILENPAQAADFAASVGAVSVVFGVPVDKPDRNSDELLELVLNSSVCDKATLTFLSQFYPENAESYDTMMNSAERCAEIFATPILWRPVGRSNCLTAKLIVTMAGLNCVDYGDLAAVVSSSVAMTAVAASQTAMAAVAASSTAMTAVAASQTAMTAVAASPTAMAAIWQSSTAVQAVQNNATAWSTFTGASSSVIGKTVAILSGLDPNSYADMTAVAASQTAMAAVAASSTAMAAVAASSTAMAAVIATSTALNAVVSSSTAMAAVAASSTAMTAVASSATAVSAMAASSAAKSALQASPLKKEYSWGGNNWTANTLTAVSGSGLLLKIQITNNVGGWSLPTKTSHKVLLDGAAFMATNGYSTSDIYQKSTSAVIDESVRRYKSSINVYLYNATKITYIPC